MDWKIKNYMARYTSARSYYPLLLLLLGSAAYSAFILFPPPLQFTRLFSEFNLGLALFSILLFGVLFSRKGFLWDALSLSAVLMLFAVALIYKWQHANYDGQLIGGLLPLSDAQSYFSDGQLLLTGNHVTPFSTRRPLFAGLLAMLLFFTGNNLQAALAILTALTGLSIYLAAREIQGISNPFSAAVYLIVCYWFFYPFAGTTMTENLGVTLGSLALAILLAGLRLGLNLRYLAAGLFALTIGLNARAGAFFILPALVIWTGIIFRNTGRARHAMLIASLAIAAGMASNLALTKLVGSPKGAAFSNFSYTLYGLASGYTGWWDAAYAYPDLSEAEIYQLAFEKFKQDPMMLAAGISRSFLDYFTPLNGAFNFMRLVYDQNNMAGRILWTFLAIGLITGVFARRQADRNLMLASFAGIFLSLSFLPPIDSDSMRVQATTIPFLLYIVAIGTSAVGLLITRTNTSPNEEITWDSSRITLPVTSIVLVFSIVGPLALIAFARPPKPDSPLTCSGESREIFLGIGSGSSIHIIRDDAGGESYAPYIRVTDFLNGVLTGNIFSFYLNLDQELLGLRPGQSISAVTLADPAEVQPDRSPAGYLVTSGMAPPPGYHRICATPGDDLLEKTIYYYSGAFDEHAGNEDRTAVPDNALVIGMARIVYALAISVLLFAMMIERPVFRALSAPWRVLLLLNIALILSGPVLYLHSSALLPLSWQRIDLETSEATHEEGHAYKVLLGVNWMNQKSIRVPPVTVYEDGVPLKRPNEKIFALKKLGQGRFFVQDGYLYVSTSDNSDPRTNGRRYEIEWPTPVRLRVQVALYALSGIGLIFYLWRFTSVAKHWQLRFPPGAMRLSSKGRPGKNSAAE